MAQEWSSRIRNVSFVILVALFAMTRGADGLQAFGGLNCGYEDWSGTGACMVTASYCSGSCQDFYVACMTFCGSSGNIREEYCWESDGMSNGACSCIWCW